MTRRSSSSSSAGIVIWTLAISNSFISAESCLALAGKSGDCIPIGQCPSIFSLTKRPFNTASIRALQKLTCGFDGNDPKVCCLSRSQISTKTTFEERAYPKRNVNIILPLMKCGNVHLKTNNRIIGGKVPNVGAYPWLARVGYSNPRRPKNYLYYCAGSVVNKRYILTAAHCVIGFDTTNIPQSVRLGEHDENTNPEYSPELELLSYFQDFSVEKLISHPKYDPYKRQNDIALIRLSKDISFNTPFIQPICLPFVKDYYLKTFPNLGSSGYNSSYPIYADVAGWGKTETDSAGSEILNYAQVPIIANTDCKRIYEKKTDISESQMCAGGKVGQDSCDGDSGGPLTFFEESVGKHFQASIVSYGPTICGSGGLPGIYTRVSEYLDWILDSIE